MELQSRYHSLNAEQLDHVGVRGGHYQLIRFITNDVTDQAVRTVRCRAAYTIMATDGEFDLAIHLAPFAFVHSHRAL